MFFDDRFASRVCALSFEPLSHYPTANVESIILCFPIETFYGLKPSTWVVVYITKSLLGDEFLIFHLFVRASKYTSKST